MVKWCVSVGDTINIYQQNTHAHANGKSNWHIEWCTKYRYKVFKRQFNKNLCYVALLEAAKVGKINVVELEVQPEHVHLIVELPLTVAPVDAIRKLKSISAKIIFNQLPKLRYRYPKGHIWSRGKFAITVGNITLEKAKEYVANQKAHHAKELLTQLVGILALERSGRVARRARVYPEEDVKIFPLKKRIR